MRIPPRPVEVLHGNQWYPATLHTWDVDHRGNATGVASFIDTSQETCVRRFPEHDIREAPRVADHAEQGLPRH